MTRYADLLTGPMAAARAGMTYNAWKLAPRTRIGRPPPDHRFPWGDFWNPSTIDAYRRRREAARWPTHAEILADPAQVSTKTYRRHLSRHDAGECGCPR